MRGRWGGDARSGDLDRVMGGIHGTPCTGRTRYVAEGVICAIVVVVPCKFNNVEGISLILS